LLPGAAVLLPPYLHVLLPGAAVLLRPYLHVLLPGAIVLPTLLPACTAAKCCCTAASLVTNIFMALWRPVRWAVTEDKQTGDKKRERDWGYVLCDIGGH
jgi:hypothetical protein